MYTAEQIASVTGAPLANVQATWPATVQALAWAGIDDHWTRIAAIATIATETGAFFPIEEEGNWNYFLSEFHSEYEAQYHGRGTIQCSWSYNYKHYGDLIGIDLLDSPALALRQDVAAKVLALYFKEHNVPGMAAAGEWYGVRRSINGGLNGIDTQMRVVNALLNLPEPPDGPAPTPPPPPVTTVAIAGALKTEPNNTSPAAIGPDHKPVHLAVGQVVTFSHDPDFPHDPGDITTPHYAHVSLPNSPVHGWFLRSQLQTVGG